MLASALMCTHSPLNLHVGRRRSACSDVPRVPTHGHGMRVIALSGVSSKEVVDGDVTFRVLITGSTKGLGLALAQRFLEAGDKVLVTSRDSGRVETTVNFLREQTSDVRDECRVFGTIADVSDAESVSNLASFASEKMGGVDLWINNAGANGYVYENLAESDPAVLREIVLTNSLGSLLCSREAIRMMSSQPGGGHVFNLLGAGSDGGPTKKYAAYGHTKAGLMQLTKTLAGEVEGTSVGVHTISPGMVFTELISAGRYAFGSQGRFFVNAFAEPPAVAAEEIVTKVRTFIIESQAGQMGAAAGGGGTRALQLPFTSGGAVKSVKFEVLTPTVALTKIFRRLVLGEGKDRYYPEADDADKL